MSISNASNGPTNEEKDDYSDAEEFLDAVEENDTITPLNGYNIDQIEPKSKPTNNEENNPYEIFANSRQILPGRIPARRLSVWTYIKEFVGRDLTKISLPITLNEPLSILHKYPECFMSPDLVQKMVNSSDPVERLENIAAHFAISQASHTHRHFKPFNPLLGETFELRKDEKKIFFLSEQISHHPPISAFYCRMPKIRSYGSFILGIKFTGNSIDSTFDGTFIYEFLDSKGNVDTVISVEPPMSSGRNIIIGNIWMEKHGVVPMIDHTSGHKLMLNFKKKGWFSSRDQYVIEGMIVDAMGREKRYVYGHWTSEVWSCSPETYRRIEANLSHPKGPDSKLLARAIPKLPNSEHYFNMPKQSIALNEKTPDMILPPTDTRLRPDIVALENGDLELASAEKHRLEEKQRAARRLREANGDPWIPMWFELKSNSIFNRDEWEFTGQYLEQKFENCPDIY